MAGELVGGAMVGLMVQEGVKLVTNQITKAHMFKTTRENLDSLVDRITPAAEEMKLFDEKLGRPTEVTEIVLEELKQGKDAVKKHSNVSWFKCCFLPRFQVELHAKREKIVISTSLVTPMNTARDVKEILSILKDNERRQQFKRLCDAPVKPDFTVGLDFSVHQLKNWVLSSGVSIHVLTGLAGSGKTTLATLLCWDDQVRGKFKENIIFITFSKTPMLKTIVERIFEHCGYPVHEFQSDEDAVNTLGLLLKKIEGSPILLVLDDVWPGSEDLVEKLQFQISDYKTLVTSRVAFSRFDKTFILKPLVHEDSVTLFHHYTQVDKNNSKIADKDLIQKVVENCKGLPLAIIVIATSLRHRPCEGWEKIVKELSQGHSILGSDTELLTRNRNIMDVLEDNPINKECFMDLALFPEGQRISVAALVDMWVELYGLDDDGIEAMKIINKLDSMNLANVITTRKNASDTENYYYNDHFIVLYDLLRELANYQNTKEPIEQRKRLLIDVNENKLRDQCLREKQQGTMVHILSKFMKWSVKPKPQQVHAHTVSISTDETCTSSDWSQVQPAHAEVLILNLQQTKQYSFPALMERMSKLKALIVINHGFSPSELNNFELLCSLSNLKRIRLERICVPSFGTLKNLKKLSLYMCNTRLAFEHGSILISDAFPNLEDLNIDYCKDLMVLPNGVCDINSLKKLSITNCHELSSLPQDIGKLDNLELLSLISCTDLVELPDSIGRLSKLRLLGISNCIGLSSLPEDIVNLCNLRIST